VKGVTNNCTRIVVLRPRSSRLAEAVCRMPRPCEATRHIYSDAFFWFSISALEIALFFDRLRRPLMDSSAVRWRRFQQ
jgi:hypothetical protein